MTAARTGKRRRSNALLKAGADVNATETWLGETALMWAAAENHGGGGHGCWSSAAPTSMRSRAD